MPKKSEYSDIKESERVNTVLSETTAFNGVLVYETSLKIDGYFKGKISTPVSYTHLTLPTIYSV